MASAQTSRPGDGHARPKYYPETVVFVLDACDDPGVEPSKHYSRFELLKQCICMFAQAKSRVNPQHKFGLAIVRDTVQWEGAGVSASAEGLAAALRGVAPAPAPPGAPGPCGRPPPLELGSVLGLVQPLAVAEEADGGRVRVVLLYCRSTVLPVWTSHRHSREGVAMDVLYVHDKTAAAAAAAAAAGPSEECASPQDVYSWLEDHVDELSSRCGHHAYILEAGTQNVKKVVNMMISLLAHPSQRPPQSSLRPAPLDLAAMPPQPTSAPSSTPAHATNPGPAAAAVAGAATASTSSAATHLPGSTSMLYPHAPSAYINPLAAAAAPPPPPRPAPLQYNPALIAGGDSSVAAAAAGRTAAASATAASATAYAAPVADLIDLASPRVLPTSLPPPPYRPLGANQLTAPLPPPPAPSQSAVQGLSHHFATAQLLPTSSAAAAPAIARGFGAGVGSAAAAGSGLASGGGGGSAWGGSWPAEAFQPPPAAAANTTAGGGRSATQYTQQPPPPMPPPTHTYLPYPLQHQQQPQQQQQHAPQQQQHHEAPRQQQQSPQRQDYH